MIKLTLFMINKYLSNQVDKRTGDMLNVRVTCLYRIAVEYMPQMEDFRLEFAKTKKNKHYPICQG